MFDSSIRNRILLAALVPLVLAVASIGIFLLTRHTQDIERHHIERSISLARQAAILAELPLATGSRQTAQQVATFIERSAEAAGLALLDREGGTVDSRGNLGATALRMLEGRPFSVQVERDAALTSVVHPVVLFSSPSGESNANSSVGGQRVGYVALSFSRAEERQRVARLWWVGATIFVLTVLLSLLLVRAATRAVSAPLATLSSSMSRVAGNDFAVRVEERGRGELRQLAADFNRMMDAINRARTGLKDEVSRATQALALRTREAETANNAKTRFLAAASHDLRQPAHALSLYVAALKQGLRQQPDYVRNMLLPAVEGMQAASGSLDALLNAVLDISRFDAGVVSPERRDVAIKTLVDDVLGTLRSTATEKGLKLRGRAPELTLNTDPNLLRRILHNLVSNAIRFSRSGSVLITARPRRDHLLLQVWDQGVGIAPNNLSQVFEEFFQVRRGDVGQGGMGLGLAIVARSVALLGGQIEVRSILGRGSCFSVRLPGTCSVQHVIRDVRPQRVVGDRRVVLVLDDDPLIRDSMRALLLAWGYEPKLESGLAALLPVAALERDRIGAVIVDYRLQDGFTGIEAARKLKQIVGAEAQVMLITGDTSPERLRALEMGGFPVMHKPLDPELLLAQLTSAAATPGGAR